MLLNGTGSARKSSIGRELDRTLENSVFLSEELLVFDVYRDLLEQHHLQSPKPLKDIGELMEYRRTLRAEQEAALRRDFRQSGDHLIKGDMQCLIQRNLSPLTYEHRDVALPLEMYFSMCHRVEDAEIDCLDRATVERDLGRALAYKRQRDPNWENDDSSLIQDYLARLGLDENETVKIAPFFAYDPCVNTCTQRPSECAAVIKLLRHAKAPRQRPPIPNLHRGWAQLAHPTGHPGQSADHVGHHFGALRNGSIGHCLRQLGHDVGLAGRGFKEAKPSASCSGGICGVCDPRVTKSSLPVWGLYLPIAHGGGETGREVEGPIAVVIVGGLIGSTFLNLYLMPALALRWGRFRAGQAAAGKEANHV